MSATIGQKAPTFSLLDQSGTAVSNQTLAGKKALIVFIPFPFTGVCEGELCSIKDSYAALEKLDAKIVAVTCDTRFANGAWAKEMGINYPILSDYWPHGAVSQAFGCFNPDLGCAMRATYVLDAEGVVRSIIESGSLKEARSFESYTEALAAID